MFTTIAFIQRICIQYFQLQVQNWPWVKFFMKFKQNMWSINNTEHTVLPGDVLPVLKEPRLEARGSRLYYIFGKLDFYI